MIECLVKHQVQKRLRNKHLNWEYPWDDYWNTCRTSNFTRIFHPILIMSHESWVTINVLSMLKSCRFSHHLRNTSQRSHGRESCVKYHVPRTKHEAFMTYLRRVFCRRPLQTKKYIEMYRGSRSQISSYLRACRTVQVLHQSYSIQKTNPQNGFAILRVLCASGNYLEKVMIAAEAPGRTEALAKQ